MIAVEQIGNFAIPLLALLYPLLPPYAAHRMISGLGGLCHVIYMLKFCQWFAGQPFPHPSLWNVVLNCFVERIGSLGGKTPSFRHLQPEDAWKDASLLIGECLLGWGPYFVLFIPCLSGLDSELREFSIWCSIFCFVSFALSIPTYSRIFTRPLAVVLSRLAARRVRWLFRFWQEDIEANAELQGDLSMIVASESERVDENEESDVPRLMMEEKGNLL
ncbi:hypothetical protein CCMA1212_000323 [Trichoderma ghanense]|uniref:Uncharacterized protein n=1 Tax=Trichoderma ghanense TaxID=65468 RepID=A0ABY2HJ42_9HYPO